MAKMLVDVQYVEEVEDLLYLLGKANEADRMSTTARHLDMAMHYYFDIREKYKNGTRHSTD